MIKYTTGRRVCLLRGSTLDVYTQPGQYAASQELAVFAQESLVLQGLLQWDDGHRADLEQGIGA
ncbi:MAG: hypothetical protein JXM73_07910 [Anaerolineae bacterium]|nr:hypothetical protein [Anaerolineae bacterium]